MPPQAERPASPDACARVSRTATGRRIRNGWALIPVLLLLIVVGGLWMLRKPILGAPGTLLDTGETAVPADIAVVLAGGWGGERVIQAAELARHGYVPRVLLSGGDVFYGLSECDVEREFAVRRGYAAPLFESVHTNTDSTRDEVQAIASELRRRGVRRCLVISADIHLRRLGYLFRESAPEIEFHYVGAPRPGIRPAEWYRSKEGRKAVLFEWTKLLTEPFGL